VTIQRHSEAAEAPLLNEPEKIAIAEASNALQQFDAGMKLLDEWLRVGEPPRVKPSHLLRLNRVLLFGIQRNAGTYRPVPILISNSRHQPPPPDEVPTLIEELCDYLNSNWKDKSAIHLAAYAIWRVNWIHPFVDGNGRTARIFSYVILCAKLGYKLPGTRSIPEQISAEKGDYYSALEGADVACSSGSLQLTAMENLLSECLATQLLTAHDQAVGGGGEHKEDSAALERAEQTIIEIKKIGEKYVVQLDGPLKGIFEKNIIERNPALFNGIFLIFGTVLGALLAVYLAR
jgi:Fic family protein